MPTRSLSNRTCVLATSVAGVVAVLLSWLVVGSHGPLSALVGAALVLLFFSAGTLPFRIAGDTKNGRGALAFLVLGLTYVLRILLGAVVYQVATRQESINSTAVGLTIIGCALVWTNTKLVVGMQRRNQPMLDLPPYQPPLENSPQDMQR